MLIRVAMPGRSVFQLRKGEEGLSVFETDSIVPPLTAAEILDEFRAGSVAIIRSREEIERLGLRVVAIEGASTLPDRLRKAHAELHPGDGMTRKQFKRSLEELEDGFEEP